MITIGYNNFIFRNNKIIGKLLMRNIILYATDYNATMGDKQALQKMFTGHKIITI